MPAWRRYSGSLYASAGAEIGRALGAGIHVAILSGAYGAVLAGEPIGQYDCRFQIRWWPNAVVGHCLASYAQVQGLSSVVAFLAATTDYAKAVRNIEWASQGINAAYLVSPNMVTRGGAQIFVPRTLGEATAQFLRGGLASGWRSADGLALTVLKLG